MANAPRDDNYIPTLTAVSNVDGTTPVTLYADPTTHRLLVSATGGLSGPESSTDNALVTWDGTDGDTLQDSSATLSDAGTLTLVENTDSASVDVLVLNGDRSAGTPTDNDEAYLSLGLSHDGTVTSAAVHEFARITWVATDVSEDSEDGRMDFAIITGGTLADELSLNGSALYPSSNDGLALGIANTNEFSDVFLASGGIINFNNGDITLTHSSNKLTHSGGDYYIDNGFGLVIGHTSNINVGDGGMEFTVVGTGAQDSGCIFGRWSASATGPVFKFVKSRNATIGSKTIVQDNDPLGSIKWYADDGNDFTTVTAEFLVEVDDASPAQDDIGVAYVWLQLPGGGDTSRNETMRLDAVGNLTLSTGASIYLAEKADATADVAGFGQLWVDNTTPNVLMFTDDAGNDRIIAHDATTALESLGTVSTGLTGVLRADSGVLSVDSDVTDIVTAASTTTAGKIEVATAAETTTGTDATRAVSPDGLAGSNYGKFVVSILVFDDSADVATGDGAGDVFWRVPAILNGWNLVDVEASHQTAGTGTGSDTTDIQINNVTQAADMLSVVLTIDEDETDSSTAATGPTIDTDNDDVATGDQIRIDVDAVTPTTAPKGLLVELTFQLP